MQVIAKDCGKALNDTVATIAETVNDLYIFFHFLRLLLK